MSRYLPPHWEEWLKNEGPLQLSDFNGDISLEFEDESTAYFKYACVVVDEERKELCIFTEHCGYHVFSLHGLKVKKYGK